MINLLTVIFGFIGVGLILIIEYFVENDFFLNDDKKTKIVEKVIYSGAIFEVWLLIIILLLE